MAALIVWRTAIVTGRVVGGIDEWSNHIVWSAATSHLDNTELNTRTQSVRYKSTAPVRSEQAERTVQKHSPSTL